MKKMMICFCMLTVVQLNAQDPVLKVGSPFPEITISHISNAPLKEIYLNKVTDNKYYILNFWGTWCGPCLPEMDTLAVLQKSNEGKIQIIAISDDNEDRKSKYLKKKPSGLWLATDTNYTLYNMLGLAFVGQSAIISADRRIVALVRTDSINQQMINKILRGDTVLMSAGIKEANNPVLEEAFDIDSSTLHSFTIRGYKKGLASMSNAYWDHKTYKDRRITFFNMSIGSLYRAAYGIKSFKHQEVFDSTVSEMEVYNYNMKNKTASYCVDLLVKPEQKDSLYIILQQYLNKHFPVQSRLEKKFIEVLVLKQKSGMKIKLTKSVAEKASYGFSGAGYNGVKVLVSDFASDYLTNELEFPVVDETGLTGFYDIKTNVELRNREGILQSIEKLGLTVEKAIREMPVIVYYK